MKTRLVIFDFDGTLADTTATILATYRMTIEAVGAEPRSDQQVRATIGLPLKEGFRQLFPQFSEEQLDRCTDTYREIFEENRARLSPKLFPGVADTLAELDRRGIAMSVASSRSNASLMDFCREHGMDRYMKLVLGADSVTRAKPDPEPVLITLRQLGVAPEEAVVVGDMPVDIAMGRGAGCRTVAVTYGNASRADLAEAGATHIIDHLPDPLPLLPD